MSATTKYPFSPTVPTTATTATTATSGTKRGPPSPPQGLNDHQGLNALLMNASLAQHQAYQARVKRPKITKPKPNSNPNKLVNARKVLKARKAARARKARQVSKGRKKKNVEYTYGDLALSTLPTEFQELSDHGFMVIENVLSAAECDSALSGIYDWFEAIGTGINRHDRTTFRNKRKPAPMVMPSSQHGIYQQYGVGSLVPLWQVRANPKVIAPWCRLWGVSESDMNDMLVANDGFSLKMPKEHTRIRYVKPNNWYHFDQAEYKLGRHCVQGFVNVGDDLTSRDDTLWVLKNSHKYFMEFFQRFGTQGGNYDHGFKNDWVKFSDGELEWLLAQDGVEEVKVEIPRGAMVLWESRLAHCGGAAEKERKEPHVCAKIYTSYYPSRMAGPVKPVHRDDNKPNDAEMNAMAEHMIGHTTPHWGHRMCPTSRTVKRFGVNPRFGLRLDEFPTPPAHLVIDSKHKLLTKVGPLACRLAGFR